MSLLAIEIRDVNEDLVPGATVLLTDKYGRRLTGTSSSESSAPYAQVFDLGDFDEFDISWSAPHFFPARLKLSRDLAAGDFSVPARSARWGYYSTRTETWVPLLVLIAPRIRGAPRSDASPPATDQKPPIVYDPGGVLVDGSGLLAQLYTGPERAYPVVLGPEILGDAAADDWRRFKSTNKDVDPGRDDGGTAFYWLEYGDPEDSGVRLLVAVWATNRAGARADKKADAHIFFCPRTQTENNWYAPAEVYPYKVKRNEGIAMQPYTRLAYIYLSSGSPASGTPPGTDFGIAYQSLAAGKSNIVVMPINNFGDWGPLLSRAGLLRLLREVVAHVSDHTVRAPPPLATLRGPNVNQGLNRVAVSGYSSGAEDAAKLFRTATIEELARLWGLNKTDKLAQRFAGALSRLKPGLWQSPPRDLDRSWHEYYSVDGFYGSAKAMAFPAEIERWFTEHEQRIVRIYATRSRMSSPEETIKARLGRLFEDLLPSATVDRPQAPGFEAREWRRRDNRATLAWFGDSYMEFGRLVASMPMEDAHHTIPRVVFSHAIAQSRFLDP